MYRKLLGAHRHRYMAKPSINCKQSIVPYVLSRTTSQLKNEIFNFIDKNPSAARAAQRAHRPLLKNLNFANQREHTCSYWEWINTSDQLTLLTVSNQYFDRDVKFKFPQTHGQLKDISMKLNKLLILNKTLLYVSVCMFASNDQRKQGILIKFGVNNT